MENNKKDESKIIKFLTHQYDDCSRWLQYEYTERDRYFKFYFWILTAFIAATGYLVTAHLKNPVDVGRQTLYWILFGVSFIISIFGLFTLYKILYCRMSIITYMNLSKAMRRELLRRSSLDENINMDILELEDIILSTEIKPFYQKGSDLNILRLIALLTAISIVAIFYFFPLASKVKVYLGWVVYVIYGAIFFGFYLLLCQISVRRRLEKKEDKKYEKLKEYLDANPTALKKMLKELKEKKKEPNILKKIWKWIRENICFPYEADD